MPPTLKTLFGRLRSNKTSKKLNEAGDKKDVLPIAEGSSSVLQPQASPFNTNPTLSTSSPRATADTQLQVSQGRPIQVTTTDSAEPSDDGAQPIAAFFSNARYFQTGDINYVDKRKVGTENDSEKIGWDLLVKHTAPNALYDSDARFDAPKCDEDTRKEVTAEIMGWIQDREGPQRLLCITGAAGAGKSAIQQTITERCSDLGILGASFFFGAGDNTRNTVAPFVATIAYNLALASPVLRKAISQTVEKNPLIFTKSLQKQMQLLIVEPMLEHRSALDALPYVILIDGLDECKDELRQADLLIAIEECLLLNNLPFRVLIASRPEIVIHGALDSGGHLHSVAYHIQLSDDYDASSDIRKYLRRRFRDIARRCKDKRAQSGSWPGEDIIELLVRNASGQFIYAATVIKYISDPRSSAVDRLQAIVRWVPGGALPTKPFAALDNLYRNILTIARDNYRDINGNEDEFLLLFRISTAKIFQWMDLPGTLCLADSSFRTLFSDMRSLVNLTPQGDGKERLEFYHKSFQDFLDDPDRAGDLYVSYPELYARVVCALWFHIDQDTESEAQLGLEEIRAARKPVSSYSKAVHIFPIFFLRENPTPRKIDAIRRYTTLDLWRTYTCLQPVGISAIRGTLQTLLDHGEVELVDKILTQLESFFETTLNDSTVLYLQGVSFCLEFYPDISGLRLTGIPNGIKHFA